MPKLQVLHISDSAKYRIGEIMDIAPKGTIGLRVSVNKGGCSGYKYEIDFAHTIHPMEEVVDLEQGKIIIAPNAMLLLVGSTMEYTEDKFSSGFDFTNPNEKGRCGCGESFIV